MIFCMSLHCKFALARRSSHDRARVHVPLSTYRSNDFGLDATEVGAKKYDYYTTFRVNP